MTTMVAHSRLAVRPSALSAEQLAGMARTFDDAAQAVWVQDLSGRCVYRNRLAGQTVFCPASDTLHEILDHENHRIGQLRLQTG